MEELIAFAKRADWVQVVLNQGPPCFHVDPEHEPGRFCLRAERWDGHREGEWPYHRFVSLADLLSALQQSHEQMRQALQAVSKASDGTEPDSQLVPPGVESRDQRGSDGGR